MKTFYTSVGEHVLQISYDHEFIREKMAISFRIDEDCDQLPDMILTIYGGYGSSFKNYQVKIAKTITTLQFSRADYEIRVDSEYRSATLLVHDELALKHALTNLYSSFIVKKNWGLLIHSSCVLEEGVSHLFAGHSGAGKSTAARLSAPRELLSDEATLMKISSDGIKVFNSPFRSEMEPNHDLLSNFELSSINLLHQASHVSREQMKKSDAFMQMMDKVFYWEHCSNDTQNVFTMLKQLIESVPVYHLEFQKNNLFWELISNDTVYSESRV